MKQEDNQDTCIHGVQQPPENSKPCKECIALGEKMGLPFKIGDTFDPKVMDDWLKDI